MKAFAEKIGWGWLLSAASLLTTGPHVGRGDAADCAASDTI